MHRVLHAGFLSLMLAAVLLTIVGCKGKAPTPGPATRKPVIGISVLTLANPFFVDMADAMKAQAAKAGFECVVVSGELDAARQAGQVDDFLSRKVDAIVLCPVDSKAIGAPLKKANAAGVPVFTADIAVLSDEVKVVSHVATDNLRGGELAGEEMARLLASGGKVAVIDHPEVESVILRTRGFEGAIAKAAAARPDHPIEIVARLPGKGARDESLKAAEAILQAHPDIAGIFAINDPSALGALAAIEKAGLAGKIVVIGFDGQPEAVEAVKAGRIKADVLQHPASIGTRVIELVEQYRAGTQVPPQELIAPTLVTPETLKDAPAGGQGK
jgi:ribose transport system substrate-binding protein